MFSISWISTRLISEHFTNAAAHICVQHKLTLMWADQFLIWRPQISKTKTELCRNLTDLMKNKMSWHKLFVCPQWWRGGRWFGVPYGSSRRIQELWWRLFLWITGKNLVFSFLSETLKLNLLCLLKESNADDVQDLGQVETPEEEDERSEETGDKPG